MVIAPDCQWVMEEYGMLMIVEEYGILCPSFTLALVRVSAKAPFCVPSLEGRERERDVAYFTSSLSSSLHADCHANTTSPLSLPVH